MRYAFGVIALTVLLALGMTATATASGSNVGTRINPNSPRPADANTATITIYIMCTGSSHQCDAASTPPLGTPTNYPTYQMVFINVWSTDTYQDGYWAFSSWTCAPCFGTLMGQTASTYFYTSTGNTVLIANFVWTHYGGGCGYGTRNLAIHIC